MEQEKHGTIVSITPITDEDIAIGLENRNSVPTGVPEECECLYEYNPTVPGGDILNVNLCCDHCLWVYNKNK